MYNSVLLMAWVVVFAKDKGSQMHSLDLHELLFYLLIRFSYRASCFVITVFFTDRFRERCCSDRLTEHPCHYLFHSILHERSSKSSAWSAFDCHWDFACAA